MHIHFHFINKTGNVIECKCLRNIFIMMILRFYGHREGNKLPDLGFELDSKHWNFVRTVPKCLTRFPCYKQVLLDFWYRLFLDSPRWTCCQVRFPGILHQSHTTVHSQGFHSLYMQRQLNREKYYNVLSANILLACNLFNSLVRIVLSIFD